MKKIYVNKIANSTLIQTLIKFIQYQLTSAIGLCLLIFVGCQSLNQDTSSFNSSGSSSSKESQNFNPSKPNLSPSNSPTLKPGDITFMSYNVENLFDTTHDPDKKDWEYLPLSEKSKPEVIQGCESSGSKSYQVRNCLEKDWNESILSKKMHQLGNIFRQVTSKSATGETLIGPDIATLMEVENISVLKKFIQTELASSKYQTIVLIEGEDQRGIDVAIVSRFPLANAANLKLIDFSDKTLNSAKFDKQSSNPNKRPMTRGLLHVPLKLPNGTIGHVIALHFPSQMNPVQERMDAIQTLNQLKSTIKPNELIIAAGDTNITSEEEQEYKIFSNLQNNSIWNISHFVGCKTCEGTHNYKGSWSFLDVIFIGKSLDPDSKTNVTSYKYLPESIQTITTAPDQVTKGGRPKRFDDEKGTGYSDHLPIMMVLTPR